MIKAKYKMHLYYQARSNLFYFNTIATQHTPFIVIDGIIVFGGDALTLRVMRTFDTYSGHC